MASLESNAIRKRSKPNEWYGERSDFTGELSVTSRTGSWKRGRENAAQDLGPEEPSSVNGNNALRCSLRWEAYSKNASATDRSDHRQLDLTLDPGVNMNRYVLLATCAIVLSACGPDPRFIKQMAVPRNVEIGVVPFQDCMIAGQDDCDGSGIAAASIFAHVFSEEEFRSVLVSRPVNPKETLSDIEAVALAKARGLGFVINGEVTQFYSVAAMTFRPDRAGISVRILNVGTGEIAAAYSVTRASKTNFATPEGMIEDMAYEILDELEDSDE